MTKQDRESLPSILISRGRPKHKAEVKAQITRLDHITSLVKPDSLPIPNQEVPLANILQASKVRTLNSKEGVRLDSLGQLASYSRDLDTREDQFPDFLKPAKAATTGDIGIADLPDNDVLNVHETNTTTIHDHDDPQRIKQASRDDIITRESRRGEEKSC